MALKETKHIPQGRLAPIRKHSKAFEEENIQQQTGKGPNQPNQINIVETNEGTSTAAVLEPDKSTNQTYGLSLMSRVRVADAAINREQQAFFSKYGISTTSCGGDAQNQVEEKQNNNAANNSRGFLCLKNVNLNGGERGIEDSLSRRYLYSYYWSTLMLSNVCEVPWPIRSSEFIIVCVDLMFGVLIFATIVGNVGSMIASSEAARRDFQSRIDNVKRFLRQRNVNKNLIQRINNWFDYIWQQNKQAILDGQDDLVLSVLPTKLQAEIAMHVHFETLRKVRLFQDCEAGLLGELVLKLKLQVFSPGDFVCRKGDVGREMYIVKKGRLQVVSDDGMKIFHTLLEGAVFGELSLLNIPGSKHGNRRSASIRSVGYTDLFVLKKADLWEALREYPEAKRMLVHKGREILLKDGLLNEDAPLEEKSPEQWNQELREQIDRLLDKQSNASSGNNKAKLLKNRASELIIQVPVRQLKRIARTEGIGSLQRETQHFVGKCYQLNFDEADQSWLKHQVQAGINNGLQIIADAHTEEQIVSAAINSGHALAEIFENGFRYYVHDQNAMPYLSTEGISVSPGTKVYSAISPTNYLLLSHNEWGNCTNEWPLNLNKIENSDGGSGSLITLDENLPYSLLKCKTICLAKYFYERCGCSPFIYNIEEYFSVCTPYDTYKCINYGRNITTKNQTDENNEEEEDDYSLVEELPTCTECKMECHRSVYHIYNSYAQGFSQSFLSWIQKKKIEWTPKHVHSNFVAINIFFRDICYTEYKQIQSVGMTEILSDIGGNMGLFLGMSLVSVIELATFLWKITWIFISKKRREHMIAKKCRDEEREKHLQATMEFALQQRRFAASIGRLAASQQLQAESKGTKHFLFYENYALCHF
uniref:Cyclic nucleotide-binding domain-containing protein n=1 Tax=Meloidogyne javanica TaxID=6303 RepID=A0A915NCB7_MELJA